MLSNTAPTLAFHSPFSMPVMVSALRRGELSLFAYLDELEAHFEEREPEIQAFVPENGRFARLRREAEALLARYPDPEKRPLLFGLPVGVKDIFHVDGFVTRAGSRLPAALLQGQQADVVTRLAAAGALILGKTVTTEFAYFAPGPTRNPYNVGHTPGGSSSGSAAGVGAGLCMLALGSQTIGSINRPAAYCGVVGLKPTYDRVSKAGVIPLSPSADTVGFFAPDAASASFAAPIFYSDWQRGTAPADRLILGVPTGSYLNHASSEALAHFDGVLEKLRQAGFVIQSVPVLADFDDVVQRHQTLVAAETAQVHAAWFAQYPDLYHAKTSDLIRRGQTVSAEALAAALAGRETLRRQLSAVMAEERIDLWLSPSAVGSAPVGLDSTGDPVLNLPWTHAGLPTMTLPAGFNEHGLPLGLQLAGRWYGDEALVAAALSLESALQNI